MRADIETTALFEIATSRNHLAAIEVSLMTIAGDLAPPDQQPMVGRPDLHFTSLLAAESRFGLMDEGRVASVAGGPAGDAVRAYQESFRDMREVYGLACGPDRDAATAAALMDTLRGIAMAAHRQLTLYNEHTRGLDVPTLEEYTRAVGRRGKLTHAVLPEPPRPLTPKIRKPLDGDVAATRARAALGYAFGGLASAFLKMQMTAGPHTGMVVLTDLAAVIAWIGYRASHLNGRCAHDDLVLAARIEGASDDLDALYHDLEQAIAMRNAGPEALPDLAETVKARIPRLRDAVRAVERFAAERGYTIAPPAFRPAPEITVGFTG